MKVGFTITDLRGNAHEAITYIKSVCILESQKIADNLINSGKLPIHVYAPYVKLAPLGSLPFDFEYIEPEKGKYVVASIVNFMIEIPYKDSSIRLLPTQYKHVPQSEMEQILPFIRDGLVRSFPEYSKDGVQWILEDGYWDDEGRWIDMAEWND